MRQPISPQKKAAIKKSYLTEGLSLEAAAAKHSVSARKVHGWSSAEGWAAQKFSAVGEPVKLVSFPSARGGQQAQEPEVLGELPQSLGDLVKILDEAIARMAAAVRCPSDGRNRANAGSTLAKLISERARLASDEWLLETVMTRHPTPADLVKALRGLGYGGGPKAEARAEPLKPMTAADIAQQAMDAGIKPHEFLTYLKQAWEGDGCQSI